jgi:hypothetical protein
VCVCVCVCVEEDSFCLSSGGVFVLGSCILMLHFRGGLICVSEGSCSEREAYTYIYIFFYIPVLDKGVMGSRISDFNHLPDNMWGGGGGGYETPFVFLHMENSLLNGTG